MEQPTCKDCRYWRERCKEAIYTYPGVKYGECRRSPPILSKRLALFPEVGERCWCGEFKSKVYKGE